MHKLFLIVRINFAQLVWTLVLFVILGGAVSTIDSSQPINSFLIPNETPAPPFNLSIEQIGTAITFRWGFGLDAETFFTDLGYDIRIGSTPGGNEILQPASSGPGNQGAEFSTTIDNLGPGTYYWSVQAVDEEFARSDFATEQVFSIQDDEFEFVSVIPGQSIRGKWVDYDNDGDLDIIGVGVQGLPGEFLATEIYRNDGGKFTTLSTSFPDVVNGIIQVLDYDNDNDMDVFLQGSVGEPANTANRRAQLYENINGNLVDTGFSAGVSFLCSTNSLDRIFADVDNNGFVDLLHPWIPGGLNGSIGVKRNFGGQFESLFTPWVDNTSAGTLVPGDYNNDGQIDIFSSGLDNSACKGPASSLNKNTGNSFEFSDPGILSGFNGRPAFGDYDADGDLDIITAGAIFGGLGPGFNADYSGIYRNDGGTYTLATELLPSTINEPAWADYDMDGDLDVILPGQSSAVLYENRKGTFVNIAGAFDGLRVIHAEWGDYDGDGDLDVMVTGFDEGSETRIYKNTRQAKNDAPLPPSNLSTTVSGNLVSFSWNGGSDKETPSPGLTYNLRVGTSPGANDAMSSMALKDGKQLHPGMGNVYHNTSWTLNGLAEGTYYWSVQTVDGGYAGSVFAEDKSFTIGGGGDPDAFTDSNIALVGLDEGDAEWGDYDNDGDLDLLLTGTGNSGATTRLYTNSGNSLTDSGMSFENLDLSDAAWSDFDLDGDLDFVLTGRGADDTHVSVLYINQDGSFEAQNNVLPGILEGAVEWGDYDNDGDPDLLITGLNSSLENINRVYRNDGGTFTDIEAGLTGIRRGDISWVDYDVDGDLDILVSGRIDNVINRRTILYNNSEGIFTEFDENLPDVDLSGLDWGDYDRDGDPDLILIGTTGSQFIAAIYRNDAGNLVDINANLPGTEFGDAQWGDYDNDGDLDVLLSGSVSGNRQSEVYRNDGGSFSSIGANLSGVSKSSVAWGDYDKDEDLDAFVMGQISDNERMATLYTNNATIPNTSPSPPAELWAVIDIETVTLNWSQGSDKETASSGLTYNLRMGTSPGGNDIMSPHASASGERNVVRTGNAGQVNAWAIRLLKAGTYYWSVQSIDAGYAGSAFSSEHSFTLLDDLLPVELTSFTGIHAGGTVQLEWETASETNNAGFSIERSSDGNAFFEIDFVAGRGTTSLPSAYTYSDTSLPFADDDLYYRLKQVDFDGQFAYSPVIAVSQDLPTRADLWSNYPNPFNPSTEIRYELPVSGHVFLAVYDATGKEVAILVDGFQEAGRFDARFDGAQLASGVYFYRLETASMSIMKQMILLK